MNKKIAYLLIHLPVWLIVFIIILAIGFQSVSSAEIPFLISMLFIIAFWLLSSFYFFYSYLIPKYLENHKFRDFIIIGLLFIIVLMPAINLLLARLTLGVFGDNTGNNFLSTNIITPWLGNIAGTILCGGLGTLFRFTIDWFKNLHLKKELENKNLQSELEVLKARLNPHLLFNTLNNIDTLMHSDNQQASIALSKLSDILRYTVYDVTNDQVPIQKEIAYIKKYIDLEKLRVSNANSVVLDIEIKNEIMIPPMIFLPYIENALKHSNLNNKEQFVKISLINKSDALIFNCINTVNENPRKTDDSGIGLEIAKKRLELLFPNKHDLIIESSDKEYKVSLKLFDL